jgi:hypothetical protein
MLFTCFSTARGVTTIVDAIAAFDQVACCFRIGIEHLERLAELHSECEQPLLRAVVQIALDLPAVGDGDVDRACLRFSQDVDLFLELTGPARAERYACERRVEPREPADHPRRQREHEQAGDRGRHDFARRVEPRPSAICGAAPVHSSA